MILLCLRLWCPWQLEVSRKMAIKHVPTMVRPETERPLAHVSAGTDSTVACDREGQLMVWGAMNKRVRPDQVAFVLRGKFVRQVR